MKKKFLLFVALVILISPARVLAYEAQQSNDNMSTAKYQIIDNQAVFSLSDLGFGEKKLLSPIDSFRVLFSVPPNWQLASGGFIELHYEVSIIGLLNQAAPQNTNSVGGDLFVRFNGVIIGTIKTDQTGDFVLKMAIPDEALVSVREDGRHVLSIDFDAQLSCNYNAQITVVVKPTSFFNLNYQEGSPQLNFTRFPAPFYLENSIIPDSSLIIVPDNPDQMELQAAINVAAGLGSIINNDYTLDIVRYGDLDETSKSHNHLIFVGLPEKFSALSEVGFSIPIRNGKFDRLPSEALNDGILELALSPWNPSKAILLVSGDSLDALSKAAFALSNNRVFVYEDPTVAFVSNVQFLDTNIPSVEKFTLEDLGYTTETIQGIGSSSVNYLFYVSRDQVLTKEGYFEFSFFHSNVLTQGGFSYALYLNNELFYTDVFSEKTTQATSIQIRIPPGFLRYGENQLEIQANMILSPSCEDSISNVEPWLTVLKESSFYLPPVDTAQALQFASPDLKYFNKLFTTSSDLGDVSFVLPQDAPGAWKVAAQLAYMFGSTITPDISNISVSYGDAVDEVLLSERSVIVVGKPSDIPLFESLNDKLPAPFDFASNTASEKQLQVSYQIPEGKSVGYLELMQSPYNPQKFIGIVAGNSEEGVKYAANALTGDLQSQLVGVFAVTNGVQIASGNAESLFSLVGDGVPGSTPVINDLQTEQASSEKLSQPVWLLPFVIVSVVIIVAILIYIVWSVFRKRQENNQQINQINEKDDPNEKAT